MHYPLLVLFHRLLTKAKCFEISSATDHLDDTLLQDLGVEPEADLRRRQPQLYIDTPEYVFSLGKGISITKTRLNFMYTDSCIHRSGIACCDGQHLGLGCNMTYTCQVAKWESRVGLFDPIFGQSLHAALYLVHQPWLDRKRSAFSLGRRLCAKGLPLAHKRRPGNLNGLP